VIPHSRPRFGPAFEVALLEVLRSGQVVMGDQAASLESAVAMRLSQVRAVVTDSGTSALMLALRAMHMQGQIRRVGIPAYVCGSVPYAVRAAGLEPVAMDCGEDLRLHAGALTQAKHLDAVVLVHPFGMVEPLAAASWPCPVIEDVAQSVGAELDGRPVGSFGTLAIGSFHATKPWGGAYGGFVAGSDMAMLEAVCTMRDPDRADAWPGYAGHHQLSDLHAAMVLVRLGWAADERTHRRLLAERLDPWLAALGAEPLAGRHEGNHFRYIVRIPGRAQQAIALLRAHGIGAMPPVPRLWEAGDCAGARRAMADCVSLPLLADMAEQEVKQLRDGLPYAFAD
jgi:dTDP-4-amino-4,6-dideoxygalactose transaminase